MRLMTLIDGWNICMRRLTAAATMAMTAAILDDSIDEGIVHTMRDFKILNAGNVERAERAV